jgi:hypothetical protein
MSIVPEIRLPPSFPKCPEARGPFHSFSARRKIFLRIHAAGSIREVESPSSSCYHPPIMPREIQPLQVHEVEELSRFLTSGFGTPLDAPFATPEVLRWKYFDPFAADFGPRSYIVRENGEIAAHVGFCPTRFLVGPPPTPPVPTLHMMDWLGSKQHPGAGLPLLRLAHRLTPMQYGLGGSADSRRVVDAVGYHTQCAVPVFQRVLRASYRLRASTRTTPRTLAAAARDAARLVLQRNSRAESTIELRPVSTFGTEIDAVIAGAARHAVFTDRGSDILNHLLRHPSGTLEGFLLVSAGVVRGFALLNLFVQGRSRVGKIVDCLLDSADPTQWHNAILALISRLNASRADIAYGCGGPPWVSAAYRANRFRESYPLQFRHRDRNGLIPRDQPFYLTFGEADYSYLP